ncbi:MAG: DUF4249 domain-containing protein, partial [Paramuribaculum sp.]|nr:DUF4249 domain-containing protein [Paramuribaculum sp.]
MAILRYLPLIILPFILTGCYEDFDPKIDTKPVLCINSLITAGEPIKVDLSRSWVYSDNTDNIFLRPGDATVTIYVNNQPMPDDYIATEGDEIHIVAESEKYGNAEATVKIPVAVPISGVKMQTDTKYSLRDIAEPMTFHTGFDLHVVAQIKDDPGTDNYFRLGYIAACPTGHDEADWDMESYASLYLGSFDDSFEPIFTEHIGVFESVMADGDSNMMTFSDRQFAGKNYNLNMFLKNMGYYVNAPEYDPELFDCTVTFYLITISRSYYNRILYLWQRDSGVLGDYGDLGFADPMWGYSNVSSNAGVVAAQSLSSYTIS